MIRLNVLMGNHPHVLPLKRGEIESNLLDLRFANEPIPHEAFKPFVRDLRFDCGELAIVTYLQAIAYGKPLVLLPFVISSRFHWGSIGYVAARGEMRPKDLEGLRVGVRTYSQTTGVWVRGILQSEYGVDLEKVSWLTFDEAHLAEFADPPKCRRARPNETLEDALFGGEIAAAVPISLASPLLSDSRIRRLIPDWETAGPRWHARTRAAPINHMLVVTRALAEERPDAVRELYRLFVAAKTMTPLPSGAIDMTPYGVEATRKGLEIVIDYAVQQGVLARRISVEEAYEPGLRALGALA